MFLHLPHSRKTCVMQSIKAKHWQKEQNKASSGIRGINPKGQVQKWVVVELTHKGSLYYPCFSSQQKENQQAGIIFKSLSVMRKEEDSLLVLLLLLLLLLVDTLEGRQ